MECEKFHDQIIEYSEDELDESARRIVEEHLDECPKCLRFLEDIRKIRESVAVEAPDPGQAYFESLTNRVMTQVRESKEDTLFSRAFRWLTASLWRPVATLAPVALALAIAIYMLPGDAVRDEPLSEDDISEIASVAEQYSPERMLGFVPVNLIDDDSEVTDDQFDSMASDLYASLDDDEGVVEVANTLNAVSNVGQVAGAYAIGYSDLSKDEVDQLHDHLAKSMDSWVI